MSSETVAETKYCSNCKKDIAAANFTMHEVHCGRHLVLCQHCHEPVPRTEMDQHFTDVHAKVACSQCAVEMEKDQLDAHLESQCSKRQGSCEYCELELPHCDLPAHLEFCSTRTEPCPRCSNFIMHKDLLRHNSSNCAYPEAKPPPPSHPPAANGGGFNFLGESFGFASQGDFFSYRELNDSFDPFEFEEIRRALEGDADGGGGGGGMQSLVEDSDASAAAGEQGRGGEREGGQGGRFGRTNVARLADQKKNDTRRGGRKVTTNRRSDVNRQRNQESPPPIPPDMDYDTMLALQLTAEDREEGAGDLDLDAHLNELINSYENRSSGSQRHHRPTPVEVEDVSVPASPPPAYDEFGGADEVMIPCEFCGETFPAFALVHHQSVCDPLASGLWGPSQDNPLGQNNEGLVNQWRPAATRPPAIPVINNLGSASPAQEHEEERSRHLSDNGDHLTRLDSLEMTMLPCEFCYELLPADSLVQHQAMCEGKPATPHVTTPGAAQPSSGFSATRNQGFNFFPTTTTGARRQHSADPTGELLAAMNQRGGQDNSGGSGSSSLGNARPKKRPNAPRNNNSSNVWSSSSSRPSPPSTTTSTSTSSSRPPPSRQARPSPNTAAAAEDGDISLHGSRRGLQPSQGRQDSANRTRHTLDSLLSEEGSENQAPARNSGANRENGGQTRQGQGSRRRTSNRGGGSTVPSGVNSRTVQMQMQQQPERRQRARGNGATEGETNTPGSRRNQRERGDHVFNSSPANASRPVANPNRSRRSTDRPAPEWE
ncbi:hypothetical protein ACOMHN_011992 [Nucella lapillus]